MPSTVHETTVLRTVKMLRAQGYVAFPSVVYQNFIFDVFAVHPTERKLKVVEVMTSRVSREEEKREWCKKNDIDMEIVLPKSRVGVEDELRSNETSTINVLASFAHPIRYTLLKTLSKGNKVYTELITEVGFHSTKDAGKFVYHLKRLQRAQVLGLNPQGRYYITDLGRKLLELPNQLFNV